MDDDSPREKAAKRTHEISAHEFRCVIRRDLCSTAADEHSYLLMFTYTTRMFHHLSCSACDASAGAEMADFEQNVHEIEISAIHRISQAAKAGSL